MLCDVFQGKVFCCDFSLKAASIISQSRGQRNPQSTSIIIIIINISVSSSPKHQRGRQSCLRWQKASIYECNSESSIFLNPLPPCGPRSYGRLLLLFHVHLSLVLNTANYLQWLISGRFPHEKAPQCISSSIDPPQLTVSGCLHYEIISLSLRFL